MFEPLIECYKNHEAKLKQMLMWLKFAYMVIFIMMIVFILGFYGTLWWQQANEVHRVLVAFGIILAVLSKSTIMLPFFIWLLYLYFSR